MKFPGTEKHLPAFRHLVLGITIAAASSFAVADTEADLKAGLEAYRRNDVSTAMQLLKPLADGGNSVAQAAYGGLLDIADFDEEAAEYYGKAAAQNNADGVFGLARLYSAGEAKAPDPDAAARLMRQAADMGHTSAIIATALHYMRKPVNGATVKPNWDAEGPAYILKAAEIGYPSAIQAAVDGYLKGDYGFEIDPARAEHWKKRLQNPASGAAK